MIVTAAPFGFRTQDLYESRSAIGTMCSHLSFFQCIVEETVKTNLEQIFFCKFQINR